MDVTPVFDWKLPSLAMW